MSGGVPRVPRSTLVVGIGGPAGCGKTALALALREALRDSYDVAALADERDAAAALAGLLQRSPGVEVVLVESRGGDFAAMAGRCDLTICVVEAGAGLGRDACIAQSDLLVINKIDRLADAGSLDAMALDATKARGARPFVLTNLETGEGLERVVDFIETDGLLDEATPDG